MNRRVLFVATCIVWSGCAGFLNPTRIPFSSNTAVDGSFNGTASGSKNIWTTKIDGSGKTLLTHNTGTGYDSTGPRVSPDGTKILFLSKSALDGSWNGTATTAANVWIMNADGTGRTALTRNTLVNLDANAAGFSPDGSKITFHSKTAIDGSWDGASTLSFNIWIMNLDGSGRTPLTQNTTAARSSAQASFSNTGQIAFHSLTALDGSWNGTATASNNIWVMNSDGTGRSPLTRNTLASRDSLTPSFSPDGTRLVFFSKTALDGSWDGTATLSSNAWISDNIGGYRKALTRNTLSGLDCSGASLSPDGIFVGMVYLGALDGSWDGSATGSTNIWLLKTDGSAMTPITRNTLSSLDSSSPRYTKDGTRIAFTSSTSLDGSWDGGVPLSSNVWIIKIDGSGRTAFTQNTLVGLDSVIGSGFLN